MILIEYLEHYGVKGMRWGIRKDRSVKTYLSKVNTIVDSMSKEDKEKLGLYDRKYSIGKGEKFVTRQLKYIKDEPVAFFDIVEGPGYVNATVGTKAGEKYRGKGYAKEVTKAGLDWWEANKSKYENKTINWWVREDNVGSAKVAQDSGFKLNSKKSRKYPGWKLYEKR